MTLRPLSRIEARVLATLMEKARTVPDTYPLSLNALVAGCNQKTSREPVLQLTDAEVQDALDSLKQLSLVMASSGSRVTRWEHNAERVLGLPGAATAILGLLMLRGPQTAGELRINTERWHRFADIGSVEAFLEELAARPVDKGGPLATLLARAPGAREPRWAHLLCGPVAAELAAAMASEHGDSALAPALAHPLEVRLGALEQEVAELKETVRKLCAELGLSQPGQA